jgi:hypothetical protein
MSESLVTSESVAPRKKPRKTAPSKVDLDIVSDETTEVYLEESSLGNDTAPEKSPIPEKNIAKAGGGRKFVYFASGSAYVTKSGFRFSADKRIYEIDEKEADHLLSLENFRLPDQLELEEYYKENN